MQPNKLRDIRSDFLIQATEDQLRSVVLNPSLGSVLLHHVSDPRGGYSSYSVDFTVAPEFTRLDNRSGSMRGVSKDKRTGEAYATELSFTLPRHGRVIDAMRRFLHRDANKVQVSVAVLFPRNQPISHQSRLHIVK